MKISALPGGLLTRFTVSCPARLALFGFLLLLSVAGLGGASGSEDAALQRGPAVRGGPPASAAVMFSGELMGWTEPCG